MDIIISARHMDLMGSMETNVREKLSRIADHFPKLNKAEVVLDVTSRNEFFAEIVLHGKGINLDSKSYGENMYIAISKAAEKMERQLDKKRHKRHDHHKHGKGFTPAISPEILELDAMIEIEEMLEAVS